jgi:hypothetical protein
MRIRTRTGARKQTRRYGLEREPEPGSRLGDMD